MIMHPSIIALFVGSILVSCMVLYSVRHGIDHPDVLESPEWK